MIYFGTVGPTILCQENSVLTGHGTDYHADGFSSPVGKIKNIQGDLSSFSIDELRKQNVSVGARMTLRFESEVKVSGILQLIRKDVQNKNLLLSFKDCTVTYNSEVLFEPSWGMYDMAVGNEIVSVFSGPADTIAYKKQARVAKEKTPKPIYDEKTKILHSLYGDVRAVREKKKEIQEIENIYFKLRKSFPSETLIILEIYEITLQEPSLSEIKDSALAVLKEKMTESERFKQLITEGLELVHKNN